MSVDDEVLQLLIGCERHDHNAVGIELVRSKYEEFVNETLRPESMCFAMKCDHDACNRYRKALTQPLGEAGTLFGVPLTIIADQPKIRVIEP